jgi:hypothetical protein
LRAILERVGAILYERVFHGVPAEHLRAGEIDGAVGDVAPEIEQTAPPVLGNEIEKTRSRDIENGNVIKAAKHNRQWGRPFQER